MARLHFNGQIIDLEAGQSVLEGLLEQGHAIANSCRAGACQSCLMQATDGLLPDRSQAGLKPTLANQGYFLACQCHPQDDLVLRLPDIVGQREQATVSGLRPLSPQVMELRLRPDAPLDYRPGQYTTLWRNDGTGRCYSLASVPALDDELVFHIRHVSGGRFSGWVFDGLEPGDRMAMQPATGDCVYLPEYADADLLLVGTATGLAPLYGILRDALHRGHRGSIHLLHGALDGDGIYLGDALSALAAKQPQLHYRAAVLNGDGGDLPTGQVDQLALAQLPNLRDPVAYLCGAPAFVNDLRKRLFIAGMASARIHADAFVPAADTTAVQP